MPDMAPHLSARVPESAPFTNTGLDYLGPLQYKENGELKKAWVFLFTCMVTRAIHLELVTNMTTDAFLNCFRRFIACRGTPKQVICDNASHFKLACDVTERVWHHILHSDEIQNYSSSKRIKWCFIVQLAPWMGGFIERLVGLTKRSMQKAIGKKLLTYDQLITIIKEAESVVNARPLVYVSDDISSTIIIIPRHFTSLNPFTGIPEVQSDENDPTYSPVLNMWKKGQELLDSFWNSWRHDYLTCLRERTQTRLKSSRIQSHLTCNMCDIVLIKDKVPRGS